MAEAGQLVQPHTPKEIRQILIDGESESFGRHIGHGKTFPHPRDLPPADNLPHFRRYFPTFAKPLVSEREGHLKSLFDQIKKACIEAAGESDGLAKYRAFHKAHYEQFNSKMDSGAQRDWPKFLLNWLRFPPPLVI
ncbi:hypothetical protein JCM10207_001589 [Rhodosporidiobolus poonsookiae]